MALSVSTARPTTLTNNYIEYDYNDPNGVFAPIAKTYSSPITELAKISTINPNGTPTGNYTSYNGGAQAPAAPVVDLSLYDNSIAQTNNALGGLDGQLGVSLGNINNSRNLAVSRLNDQQAIANRDFDANKVQTTQQNVNARSNINANTGRQSNALQRLLGSRGAGNSDAARVVAPYAAALQGTQSLNQVADTYAQNMGGLQTAYDDFGRRLGQSREEVEQQRFGQEQAARGGIASKRQNLLSSLAQLQMQRTAAAGGDGSAALAAARPYMDQVNALNGEIQNYGNQFQNAVQVTAPTYAAPSLQQYQYSDGAAIQGGQNNSMAESVSPYLTMLRRQKQGIL